MKKIFIFLLLIIFQKNVLCQDEEKYPSFFMGINYEMNYPGKKCSFCLNDEKYTGISNLYTLKYERTPSFNFAVGIKTKKLIHAISFSSFRIKFTSSLPAIIYLTGTQTSYDIDLSSDTKYFGFSYIIKYHFNIKKIKGLFTELKFNAGYQPKSKYIKHHYRYFYESEYNHGYQLIYDEFPYNKYSYGINLAFGYNQDIGKKIQLSAFTGISYRFIAMYYNIGLGINYKFDLPKKKEE